MMKQQGQSNAGALQFEGRRAGEGLGSVICRVLLGGVMNNHGGLEKMEEGGVIRVGWGGWRGKGCKGGLLLFYRDRQMQEHNLNSTQAFLKKLTEKDKQRASELYTSALKDRPDKENIPRQSNARQSASKISIKPMVGQSSAAPAVKTQWQLDLTASPLDNGGLLTGTWLQTAAGMVEFSKIVRENDWNEEMYTQIEGNCLLEQGNEGRKCMKIEIWCMGEDSFSSVLISYALPFLKYGKGTWSLAALTSNKRFDLLSLDAEGSTLWKGKTPLSKVQLQREQLLRRIFGFAGEKERAIGAHETLGKLQWGNGNVVYFILRDALAFTTPSNAHLLLEQESTIENIEQVHSVHLLRPKPGKFQPDAEFLEVMGKLGVGVKREEELSKRERERFLKSVIDKLQSELEGKQSELQIYRSQQTEIEEELPIPSERVSMGQQRYMQLKRQIREQARPL